jgi:flavin-dependent dehydrogenase
MSEAGPDEVPRLPSFQLDRAKLDERLLALAREAGAEVARPAQVKEIQIAWPESRVRFEHEGRVREVTCRWVVDASGRATLLARQLGHHVRTDEHPTAAAWGRWSKVADMDGTDVVGSDPRRPKLPQISASRRLGEGRTPKADPLGV